MPIGAQLRLKLKRRLALRLTPRLLPLRYGPMAWPTYPREFDAFVRSSTDPARYSTVGLALRTLDSEGVAGAIAELGVYRGDLSVLLNYLSPKRRLYLFDTFTGFPDPQGDHRFRDTSADYVRSRLPTDCDVDIRAGVFPDTTSGLDGEQFAFVMLDADRYQATLDGLRFFYPRLTSGSYVFIHDYHWPEFDYGAMRACREFLADKPERPIELPDVCGSLVFRRSAF